MTSPTFDEELITVNHEARYGVYAAVPNADRGQIIPVQIPNGPQFLPDGEVEAGEDHFSALKRELIEELGLSAELGYYYGRADEYSYSHHRDIYFYDSTYICEVTHFKEIDVFLEDSNSLSWSLIDKAIEKLKHDSHKWDVEAWKKNHH